MSITRIVQERLVTPMVCKRCSHTWNYTGNNPYVATCPLCRTKLSIKKNNKITQTGFECATPSQSANVANEGSSNGRITSIGGKLLQ